MGFPGGSVVKICLTIQGTQVRSLVQEGPLALEQLSLCVLQLWGLCCRAREPQLLRPSALEPVLHKISTVMRSPGTTTREKPSRK